jgi:D-3-phosphoglycerate dehydrogenase
METGTDAGDHKSLVRVTLTLTGGGTVSVAGTVTGARNIAKIVDIDGFDIDVPISDHIAVFRYHDKPGVVGVVGQILGRAAINIGGMQVSRDDTGHALIVLTVDSIIEPAILQEIVGEIGGHSGRAVNLT